jgi:hypothetical protein
MANVSRLQPRLPTVDVVVPCYNYARYLERCVSSVLCQEGVGVRVLIIDDASSDDTPMLGRRLAASDSRVELRRHQTNHGHIKTYNEGLLEWATSDYSLLLSADDALTPAALLRAHQVFSADPDVGMVYGMARVIRYDDDFSYAENSLQTDFQVISGAEFLKHCAERCYNPVPTPTAVVRTPLQHRLGGYRVDLPHTGDMEMWMRFAAHGRIGVLHAAQGEYRWHGENMGMAYYTRVLSDRREMGVTCRDVLEPLMSRLPDARLWLRSTHETLLNQAYGQAKAAFDRGDAARCRSWSEFASEMLVHVPGARGSRGLRARRLCGYGIWRTLQRMKRRLMRQDQPAEHPDLLWRPAHGELSGWWPASPVQQLRCARTNGAGAPTDSSAEVSRVGSR